MYFKSTPSRTFRGRHTVGFAIPAFPPTTPAEFVLFILVFICFTASRYSGNKVDTHTHRHTQTHTDTSRNIFTHIHTFLFVCLFVCLFVSQLYATAVIRSRYSPTPLANKQRTDAAPHCSGFVATRTPGKAPSPPPTALATSHLRRG